MRKLLFKLAAEVASIFFYAIMAKLEDKKTEVYHVVADNFCDVLLEHMARDVEKRNRQLEESVQRVRSQRSEQKGGE